MGVVRTGWLRGSVGVLVTVFALGGVPTGGVQRAAGDAVGPEHGPTAVGAANQPAYTPLNPARILESRAGFGPLQYNTPWNAGTDRVVQVTGVGSVPANATAVVLNVTAVG